MKNDVLIHREVDKQKSLLYQSIIELIQKVEAQECSILLGGTGFHKLGWQDIFRILLVFGGRRRRRYFFEIDDIFWFSNLPL